MKILTNFWRKCFEYKNRISNYVEQLEEKVREIQYDLDEIVGTNVGFNKKSDTCKLMVKECKLW